LKRIEKSGGEVMSKGGVNRVVWNRPTNTHIGPVRRSTPIEKIPFLAVARSLGDLWSYNYDKDEFIVSPVPDVFSFDIDPSIHKCIVLATDGVWNILKPSEVVEVVRQTDKETENLVLKSQVIIFSNYYK
jgi:protein phosphatase 1D